MTFEQAQEKMYELTAEYHRLDKQAKETDAKIDKIMDQRRKLFYKWVGIDIYERGYLERLVAEKSNERR